MNGANLPDLIVDSFKKLNPNALLNIYIEFDNWEDSIDLINSQIEKILVNNTAEFSQNNWLDINKKSNAYLSYASIDKILYGLGKSNDKILNQVK